MFCEFRVFRGKNNLPQNSQNSQNILLRYTPTEFTELTETTILIFCEFRVFRGKKTISHRTRRIHRTFC